MRYLGVDHGEKNIGIAISDPSGTIARPLAVFAHTSRQQDAAAITELAATEEVDLIVVGQSTDLDGKPDFSGRKAARLAAEIRTQSSLPVELWDESFSTQEARQSRIEMGIGPAKRAGHNDEVAAAIILQSYLDHHKNNTSHEQKTP
jgi:putative Holliday junction resolvase